MGPKCTWKMIFKSSSQTKALFKIRVRMAPFGENFRGGNDKVCAPSVDFLVMARKKVFLVQK